LGVNKTLDKVRQRYYYRLQARNDVEKWCRQCDTCAPSRGPRTRNRGQMHQYVGDPFERIAIDVAGPFPRSDQVNRYLQIAIDYFTKRPEAYAIPNQQASTVAEELVYQHFLPLRHTPGTTESPGP
jgi:hypothetical protein